MHFLMERYIQFIFFFAILFSVFGFMQWFVIRSYIRWLARTVSAHAFHRFRSAGLIFFALANILFILRFPSTEMGWYQHPLFQALVIYPGGIFFGAVVLAFILLVAISAGSGLLSLSRRAWHRFNEQTSTGTMPSAVQTAAPEASSPSDAALSPATATASHTSGSGSKGTTAITGSTGTTVAAGATGIPGLSRRQFLRTAGTALATAPVAFTIGASAATAHDYQINRLRLHYPGLPSGLEGLRIVQLSDIHSGIYMTETQMRDIFHLANEQNPDLVAITGDFVDNSPSEIPALYRALPDLKSEYGVFGCLGNHDHYASAPMVASALRQQGVQVLTNDSRTLRVNDEPLTLLGVDDIESRSTNELRFGQAVQNVPQDSFRILLSHRPDLFDNARMQGIDLTLAGHTHGGQIGFEIMGVPLYPIHLFHDYAKGLYEIGGSKLYVNVGIGMVGVPVRLVRPELTVIELTSRA